jgi:hypothetical protein
VNDTILEDLKQEPDRVYGLKVTRNFEAILSELSELEACDGGPVTVIRTSLFDDVADPVIFPFLLLEGKK